MRLLSKEPANVFFGVLLVCELFSQCPESEFGPDSVLLYELCYMPAKLIKLFLRLSIGVGFLSAVADRLGMWPAEVSAWGDWEHFLIYTQSINPWAPASAIPFLGIAATVLELIFGAALIAGFKTKYTALLSGWLLLIFALAMTFSRGIKAPLDAAVFAASAASFGLALIREKFLEIDMLWQKK